jgi:hypothetical protein
LIGPIPGATTALKQQDTLIGGSLSAWGATEAMRAIYHSVPTANTPYADLERIGLEAVNAATRRGTVIHDHVATLLRGETPVPTTETVPYVYSWASFIAAERPEFLAVEQKVIHPDGLFAGTLDFVAKIRGRTALGDVKSGKFKRSMALQLAAYSMCRMADERLTLDQWHRYFWNGTREDIGGLPPLPRIQDYYILLLTPTGYELVPITVTQADRTHYLRLVKNYHAMRAWDDAHKALEVAA